MYFSSVKYTKHTYFFTTQGQLNKPQTHFQGGSDQTMKLQKKKKTEADKWHVLASYLTRERSNTESGCKHA